MTDRGSAQAGVALMLVLWVLALLTVIAFGLTATQRTESTLAGNQLETARFRALAEAGITWAVLNLLAPPTLFEEEAEVWVPDGEARPWTFTGEKLEIRVFNEASRIDLNSAPRDLLESLLGALELPEDAASALADAIEDWRDADDLTGLNGAEDPEYEDAGRSYGAKDAPFDNLDELQLVLGVDRDLYQALLPALTVSSGEARPKREFAPPLVLAALDGTTLEEEEVKQEEQEARSDADDADLRVIDRGGPIYRIRVTHLVDQEPGSSMEALVRIGATGVSPFSVLWRRFGLVADRSVATASSGGEGGGDF